MRQHKCHSIHSHKTITIKKTTWKGRESPERVIRCFEVGQVGKPLRVGEAGLDRPQHAIVHSQSLDKLPAGDVRRESRERVAVEPDRLDPRQRFLLVLEG